MRFCNFFYFFFLCNFYFCKNIIPKEEIPTSASLEGTDLLWRRGAAGEDKNILGGAENNQLTDFPDLGQFPPKISAKSNISELYKPYWISLSCFRIFRIHPLGKYCRIIIIEKHALLVGLYATKVTLHHHTSNTRPLTNHCIWSNAHDVQCCRCVWPKGRKAWSWPNGQFQKLVIRYSSAVASWASKTCSSLNFFESNG